MEYSLSILVPFSHVTRNANLGFSKNFQHEVMLTNGDRDDDDDVYFEERIPSITSPRTHQQSYHLGNQNHNTFLAALALRKSEIQ